MRLFIAIEVPPEVQEYLKEVQKQLPKATLAKGFHLTLKFLGDVSPQKAEEVQKRLSDISFEPFTATLNSVGFFPSPDFVRVVWIGVEPKDQIIKLQHQIEEALEGLFEKEREFVPHLTLARIKTDNKSYAKSCDINIKPLSFEVKNFKLIESRLEPAGPVYTELGSY